MSDSEYQFDAAAIRDRVLAFKQSLQDSGCSNPWITLSINLGSIYFEEEKERQARGEFANVTIRPFGVLEDTGRVEIYRRTFEEALADAEPLAFSAIEDSRAARIEALASAIVLLTFRGKCPPSESSLRGEGFSQKEIDDLGEAAIAQANGMAEGAPFSISKDERGANEPPEGVEPCGGPDTLKEARGER